MLIATSVGLAFVHPWGDLHDVSSQRELIGGSTVPQDVRGTLETKCADCHSNRTRWPVYSRLAPGSWLMEHDVHAGRAAMNFSQWDEMRAEDRISALSRIAAEVRSGEMPPGPYVILHPGNRLTYSEKQNIAAWARAERRRIRTMSGEQKGTQTQ